MRSWTEIQAGSGSYFTIKTAAAGVMKHVDSRCPNPLPTLHHASQEAEVWVPHPVGLVWACEHVT